MNVKDLRALYNLSDESEDLNITLNHHEEIFDDLMYRIKKEAKNGNRYITISGLFLCEAVILINRLRELGYGIGHNFVYKKHSIFVYW